MKDFYVVGKNTASEIPNSPDWTKIIGYCYETNSFIFIEGNGHVFNGIVLPEQIAREPRWDRLFKTLDAHWFLNLMDHENISDQHSLEILLKSKLSIVEIIKS